uniref:MSS51 mitochondrial translational activator n=1 Tax=Eptatretus burgeri TaxID=7764 RepID=A0A8C4R5Q5_EPTBU
MAGAPEGMTSSEKIPPAGSGPHMDTLAFSAIEANVPGLSEVILRKLNLKNYEMLFKARRGANEFGIRTYHDMFRRMEDTYTFCAKCKVLPEALPPGKTLLRCKRCQNVYYCSRECQRSNWSTHKKFCKKLKLAAIDRLMEWLVYTGDIPFALTPWSKPETAVAGWDEWFDMQPNLEEKLQTVLETRRMVLLWTNAGKPRPSNEELLASVRRMVTDALSRPLTLGLALRLFGLAPATGRPIHIHVAGASHAETLDARPSDYDELLRMFPENDVADSATERSPLLSAPPFGNVYMTGFKGLYHDFWETLVETGKAARPAMVVAFHPGFHASPELTEGWLPTLLLLRDYNIPTLCTLYSEQEFRRSLQILTELEVKLTHQGPNPFQSLRFEQAQANPNHALVSSNAYLLAFVGALPEIDQLLTIKSESPQSILGT